MRAGIWAAVWLVASAMGAANAAPQMHIEYAEAVQLPASPGKAQFDAYGRRFALTLESNDRVLKAIPAASKARIGDAQVLRGKVDGVPGSWVRLTRVGSGLQGAIWDGNDIYVVASHGSIAAHLTTPLRESLNATVVYRLSDTLNGLPPDFCGLAADAAPTNKAGTPVLQQYKSLVSELRANAAIVDDGLDLSLIADQAFQDIYGVTSTDAMLARLNVIDGIFAEQVGVILVPSEFRLMPANGDPFTSTDPDTLLEQLATYREATPVVRSAGLAHLITGKNLDGNTVGVAFLDSLCDAREGVSLSEANHGEFLSALVMAHEIGHNFGARHDGVPGVCAAEPQIYLMSPTLNASAEFSACSLTSMRAAIAGARGVCIGPVTYADVALTVPPSPFNAPTNGTFSVPMTVRSLGNRTANNVRLQLTFPAYFQLMGASLSGAACARNGEVVTCALGDIAVGAERALDLQITGNSFGTFPLSALLLADNDAIRSNNSGLVQVGVQSGVDLGVAVSAPVMSVFVGDPIDYTVDVTSNGTLAARGGRLSIYMGEVPIESFDDGANTCVVEMIGEVFLACQLADMAAGATTRVTLRGRPVRAGQSPGRAYVHLPYDSNRNNDDAFANVVVNAEREVVTTVSTEELRAVIGNSYELTYTLTTRGRLAAPNVEFLVNAPTMGEIQSAVSTGVTCTGTAALTTCPMGALNPGDVRTVVVRFRMTSPMTSTVHASTRWTEGAGYAWSNARTWVYANLTVDVAANPGGGGAAIDEDQTGESGFSVETKGVDPAQNVTATIELAPPARLLTLRYNSGPTGWTCTVLSEQRGRCTGSFHGGSLFTDRFAEMRYTWASGTAGQHVATLTVNATNDGDPSNNTGQIIMPVRPFVDMGITGPTAERVVMNGQTTIVDGTITTGKNPVPNAILSPWASDAALVVDSVTVGGVDCPQTGSGTPCPLGTLPANSSIPVRAVFRAVAGEARPYATLNLYPDLDSVTNNNRLVVPLYTVNPSDLQLQLAQTSVTATNGTALQFPRITVNNGAATSRDVSVSIPLPTFVSVGSVSTPNGGVCTGTTTLNCLFFGIAPNNSMVIDIALGATAVGTFTSNVTMSAINDSTANNNSASVVVTVNAPSSSSSSGGGSSSSSSSGGGSSSSSGGGGGGGGRFEWLALAMLGALVLIRQRRGLRSVPWLRADCVPSRR